MKIFLSSDMEGTAGVVDWSQCRPAEAAGDYAYYRDLLQQEVNAAIEGAMAAGATAFLVNDAHSKMTNLRPDTLAGRARYLSGRHKPLYMMQGLDASFDAVFFVSYHGSMTGAPAALSHTYNPLAISEVRLNGVTAGESGINALVALGHGVPVVLITGDDTTAAEIEPFCPGIRSAVVKSSVSRFAADSVHPATARELIHEAARDAVRDVFRSRSRSALPCINLPATLTVRFRNPDLAEMATWIADVERVDAVTVRMTDEDPIRLYRRFVAVVMLTRGIAE
ncbi:M55 family metallopeptidase [Streptomyces sp. ET3-23]|uniref:M55 family metallopeptidase n=1 Tax=Streptomyces sp. ET3-23 TaxID=2885643 RepID=UPI001D12187A|nr:M55 family metallopeptidase [Streptomyces sp. ET3-23]MCC2280608.1 M55 family metallopeptidase [Streptomyces sp. ET3-23]